MRFAGVGAALVVAGAACLLAWFMRLPQAPTAVQTAAAAMDAVPKAAPPTREAWPPVGGVDALPASTKPRIFSAGAMADLPCLRRWDAADLAARGAAIELQCWRQSAPEFVLARGREAEFSRSRSVSLVNTTLGAFWEEQRLLQSSVGGATAAAAAAAGTPLELAYHSGPLAAWGDDLEADGEAALRALAISDAPEGQKPDQWPASSANVWMGSRGVLATPHYDTSHNIVLQVLGVKRWLLWPPAQLGALRMHPATHPSRRQARMQLTAPDGSAHGYVNTSAVEVEMRPGELMYVPPYWCHGVLSATPALSISIVSPSWLEATWAQARWVQLPFGKLPEGSTAAGRSARATAVGRFLWALLPNALPPETAPTFVRHVFTTRHAPVPVGDRSEIPLFGALDDLDEIAEMLKPAAAIKPDDPACKALSVDQVSAEAYGKGKDDPQPTLGALINAADAVLKVLRTEERDGKRRFDEPTRRELLAGYIEELAAWAVGEGGVSSLLWCWSAEAPAAK